MTEQLLVTGGAVYIGDGAVRLLPEKDYRVPDFDNLLRGGRSSLQWSKITVSAETAAAEPRID